MAQCKHVADVSVNTLLADFRQHFGDTAPMKKQGAWPNDLQLFIDRSPLNQSQLAKAVGCSRQQISDLAAGARELTKAWAVRLAPHLNVTPAQLLGLAPPGLSDGNPGFAGQAPPSLSPVERAEVAEQVAAMLRAHHLDTSPGHVFLTTERVLRLIENEGALAPFADRLERNLGVERDRQLRRRQAAWLEE